MAVSNPKGLALLFCRQCLYVGPPIRQVLLNLTAAGAQQQEIVRRPKSLVLQQPERADTTMILEAPLHDQHIFHRHTESPWI